MTRRRPANLLLLLLIGIAYLGVEIAAARSQAPFIDEAMYSMPAWNLAFNGSLGTPVIEPSGSPMPGMNVNLSGIRRHTYLFMPLPMVTEAGWFRVFGFSLLTTRLFSTFWAGMILWAWYRLVRRFGGSDGVALLAILLIASDEVFFLRASFGRMDLMSAALGFWALERYLAKREQSPAMALFLGNALVAAAGMSHPNGGMLAFLGLAWLVALDRRRLKWRHAGFAVLPYLIFGIGMGIYVLQDPAAFKLQFFSQSTGRLSALLHPFSMVGPEAMRYLNVYGWGAGVSLAGRIKFLILLAYLASLCYVALRRDLRRVYRVFLGLAIVYILGLAVLDNYKFIWYVIYTIPFFATALSIAAFALEPRIGRMGLAAALLALIGVEMAGSVRLIAENRYGRMYRPVVTMLKSLSGPNTLIAGGSELGFDYGFKDNLDDDIRLGFRSGKRPDLVAMDSRYRTALQDFRRSEPDTAAYIDGYLAHNCSANSVAPEWTLYVCRHSPTVADRPIDDAGRAVKY